LKCAGFLHADDPAERFKEAIRSVGRQPHDLAFVAVLREAQVLGERAVQKAQGVGIEDFPERRDLRAFSDSEPGGGDLAVPVEDEDQRLVERGRVKGARRVGEVVIHVMKGSAEIIAGSKPPLDGPHVEKIAQLHLEKLPKRAGKVFDRLRKARFDAACGVPVESDRFAVPDAETAASQDEVDGFFRETDGVLFAVEPFFLGEGDKCAVPNQCRGRVVDECVEAKDVQGTSPILRTRISVAPAEVTTHVSFTFCSLPSTSASCARKGRHQQIVFGGL